MDTRLNGRHAIWVVMLLILSMVITRFHHFGTQFYLPDTSYAVFLLGGFYLSTLPFLPILLASTLTIDALAFGGGADSFCITPAYLFMLLAYSSLWSVGIWYQQKHRNHWHTIVPMMGAVVVGVTGAFSIANISFYFLSGHFATVSFLQYGQEVSHYLLSYLATASLYVGLASFLHSWITTRWHVGSTQSDLCHG